MPQPARPGRYAPAADELGVDDSCAGQPWQHLAYGDPLPGLVKAIDLLAEDPSVRQRAAYRHPADPRYGPQDGRQRQAGEAYALAQYGLAVKVRTRTISGTRYVFAELDEDGRP